MELLTLTVAGTPLALLGPQISFIEGWQASHARKVPLAAAIGLAAEEPCHRAVVVETPAGPLAFGVGTTLRQVRAEKGSVLGLSRVLRRLKPPAWLAGFYLQGAELALIVDLSRLSLSPTPAPTSP